MPNNNLSFVSKFVTDCNQKAVLKGDTIEVISYVGRRKVFSYKLPLSEWTVAENAFGNPNYYKRELINKYADCKTDFLEQICVRERIMDSQVYAVEQLLSKSRNHSPIKC